MLNRSNADSVVSVGKVEDPHPVKMLVIDGGILQPPFPESWRETLRRQELPPVFSLTGAVYCVRRDVLVERDSLWGDRTLPDVMSPERSINIDSPVDLRLAEAVLEHRRCDG